MDEKTEQLRDLFVEVTDEQMITESQDAARGSLTGEDDSVDERLESVIERMRERFQFETAWSLESYRHLLRRFYQGHDDPEIAEALSCPEDVVFQARMDLHLLHEDDPRGVEIDEETTASIRNRREHDPGQVAAALDCRTEAVERALAVIRARDRTRRVSNRFTLAFEEIVTDIDLRTQFATETRDDGLKDATEGAEVDVDF